MSFVLSKSGYNAQLPIGSQPASTILGTKLLLEVISLAVLVFTVLFYQRYPLYGDKLSEVEALTEAL